MSDNDINIELRAEILKKSIEIEYEIDKVLLNLLKIKKDKLRGFNRFTLRRKVDFLHDLERITDKEYNFLALFMDIRNKFIHNKDAISYNVVLERINKKKNY